MLLFILNLTFRCVPPQLADAEFIKSMIKSLSILLSLNILTASAVIPIAESKPVEEPTPAVEVEVETPAEKPKKDIWTLPGATYNETVVLDALQDRGITDRYALATIMGNIKQESRFHTNICEGGARVGFWSCTRGGYGLIQWTTVGRYNGLARHSRRIGHDPSTISAQISYLFTEREWRGVERFFKTPGHSVSYYMNKAYYWLGWGHHGRRTSYAYSYAKNLVLASK